MRRKLYLWALQKWMDSGMKSNLWRCAPTLAWFAIYPRRPQREYSRKYHRRQIAVLLARKRNREATG